MSGFGWGYSVHTLYLVPYYYVHNYILSIYHANTYSVLRTMHILCTHVVLWSVGSTFSIMYSVRNSNYTDLAQLLQMTWTWKWKGSGDGTS
jgi:hypothetical protein